MLLSPSRVFVSMERQILHNKNTCDICSDGSIHSVLHDREKGSLYKRKTDCGKDIEDMP